jgi:iron complex outermembrane receptor protein
MSVTGILAKNIQVNGIVIDTESQLPLTGVNVYLPGSSIGTTTDNDGYFELSVPDTATQILFQYIGYKTHVLTINPQKELKHLTIKMQSSSLLIDPVVVTGTRANKFSSPTPFTQIDQRTIQENYGVRDVPMMLLEIPGVYAYSDNGTGMGYSYLSIRGFDSKRISVMINGVPHNDPEDHTVYWVDMPDLLESTSNIQIQRGIGISPYAVSSFGGSVNLFTTGIPAENRSTVTFAYGSYNTQKYNILLNKNLSKDTHFSIRLSKMHTDGYRERSGVDLWSYYFKLIKTTPTSYHQLNLYGGQEITHAAWEFSPQSVLEVNHRDNPITYHNYIDNFKQPHYEYIYMRNINSSLTFKNTLFYIHGIGYYEQLKQNQNLFDYSLTQLDTGLTGDLIRQKWVGKDQIGAVTQFDYNPISDLKIEAGSYISYYSSVNWGEIKDLLSASGNIPVSPNDFKYYKYFHKKTYLNFFAAFQYNIRKNLTASFNLYSQNISFSFKHGQIGNFKGANRHAYDLNYNYILPKFGLIYRMNQHSNLYLSIGKSQREPTANELFNTWYGADDLGIAPHFQYADTIYKNGAIDYIRWKSPKVKDEKLWDFEIGYRYLKPKFSLELNAFRMIFDDEIVPFSAIDNEGFLIRGNADQTIHEGLELSTAYHLSSVALRFNYSYSNNYFKKFKQEIFTSDSTSQIVDFSGNKIAGFPDHIFHFILEYQTAGLKTRLKYTYRGRIYLDNSQNTTRSIEPLKDLLSAQIIYKLNNLAHLNNEILLIAEFNNLLNRKYYTAGYYDSWYQENFLIPAATRNFLLTLKAYF